MRSLLFLALALAAQETPTIEITGAVKQPIKLSSEDLAKLPRASVILKHEGRSTTYEGVWLHEVLKKAGLPELRGKALSSYVVAEAKDGYQIVFSLAEIDPAFTDSEVLLADKSDGKALIPDHGPFRIIAPKEKRAARSIRMVTSLKVVMLR